MILNTLCVIQTLYLSYTINSNPQSTMLDKLKWQCWHCGACCKLSMLPNKIKAAAQKAGLKEKANGYCSNYDNKKARCSIYDSRPSICRDPKWVPGFIKTAACTYLDNKINNRM